MEMIKKRWQLGQDNNALTWLIVINAILFVLFKFVEIVYTLSDIPAEFYYRQILNWFILPANAEILVYRPWTLLTYMFTEQSVWRLIANMLWLWGFGFIMQDLTGNRILIPLYLYGGIAGAVFFVGSINLLPALYNTHINAWYMGAGASVMAVSVATTALAPEYRIFPMINGGLPLWVLTLIFVAIDFATIAGVSAPSAIGHLGGGLVGYLFIRQYRRGADYGLWMEQFWHWLSQLFQPEKTVLRRQQETHYFKVTKKPFEKRSNLTQKRVDELLDKINQKGYHFLSDEEKAFLKRAGEEEF